MRHLHVAPVCETPGSAVPDPDDEVAFILREIAGLRRAMAHRGTIEQAKGILAERSGCTPDDAFRILVQVSQRTNRKLRDVAGECVRAASARADRRTDGTSENSSRAVTPPDAVSATEDRDCVSVASRSTWPRVPRLLEQRGSARHD